MEINKIHTTNASLKIFLIVIAIMSIMLLTLPAKAESGNITLVGNTQLTYNHDNNFYDASSLSNPSINIDSTDFSQIEQIFVNASGVPLTYATNGKSTTFTITSCGTGGGTASYSKTSSSLAWYFTYPSTVTCSPLVLSYSQNIFADITSGSNIASKAFALSSSLPVFISTVNGENWVGTGGGSGVIPYFAVVDTAVTNHYVITYNSGTNQLFTTNITKSAYTSVNTNIRIENATGSPVTYPVQGDSAANYNTNNWAVTNVYGQGITINMSISNGDKTIVVINSTGSSIPTPAPTPQASPYTSGNSISTTKTTYNNTESANIFGSFYPATTTTTSCLFFGFICTDTTINTESTTGYVFISTQGSTSPIKFIPFTPDGNHNYNLNQLLDIGTYQAQLFGFAGPGSTCTNGIVYDFPFIPLGCYYPHNITTFRVVNNSGNLSIVWQTKISNSTAIYGDTISVAWSNVTANDVVVIYDNSGSISQLYNINQSSVNQIPVFIPLYTIGLWNATIYNGSNHNHNVSAYLNVVPPGSVDVNNTFGITMYWNKASDVINNPTLLNWNTGTYVGFYNISILQNGNEIRRNQYTGVPGQAQQASYTFGEQGAYIAQFLDINNTVQAQADIFISATTSSGGGTTGGNPSANQSGNNLVGASNLIINLPWIGLMVLIVVIFGLIKNGVETGMAVFVIALTTSLEALIGLWQQWGIYITILSWLLVGVFFKLNRTIEE